MSPMAWCFCRIIVHRVSPTEEKQEEVRKIFGEVFPGSKLLFIDAMPLNLEGGGIHCGTQQQPKRK